MLYCQFPDPIKHDFDFAASAARQDGPIMAESAGYASAEPSGIEKTVPIVDIQNVTYAYNGVKVLKDVNLKVQTGDFLAMIGPNGGGKTTLLKLMLGLLKPDVGTILIEGSAAHRATHSIGYVPQDVNINIRFPINALDVVLMGKLNSGKRWKRTRNTDREEALFAMERLGIRSQAGKKIGHLSGGQRQRVFIARALVTQPKLLLLDEPVTSIDTKGQDDFFRLLNELNKELTIAVVSHDLMVVSHYVKSVACVNQGLYYHKQPQITDHMLNLMYPQTGEGLCPVELVAHSDVPHRVLQHHAKRGS